MISKKSNSPQALALAGNFIPVIGDINSDTILRIHGYKKPTDVRPVIRDTAQIMLEKGMQLFEPIVHYQRMGIESVTETQLKLKGSNITLVNPDFGTVLSECTEAAVFLLTLGKKPDELSSMLQESDELLEAVFLESASWLAIERATRSFVGELRQVCANDGLRLTKRLAPGYKDWPLTDQRKLFELFSDIPIDITLLDGDCMKPKMSRSGLIGIRPASKRIH